MRTPIRLVLREPFTARTYREFGYCWLTVLPAVAAFALVLVSLVVGMLSLVGIGLLLLPGCLIAARGLVPVFARAGHRVLGWPWSVLPPPHRPVLRDRQAWGALAYFAVKLPVTLVGVYLGTLALVVGLAAVTSPVWWLFSHNGFGAWDDLQWVGTLGLAAQGAAVLLAFPWFVRLLVAIDRTVLFALVATDDARRIAELEAGRRTLTADAMAAARRIERDLHDGTQARLVSLGMVLDRAARADDPRAGELIETAARMTAETLAELRDIVRGLRPPALDDGLGTALASLAARAAVPTEFVDEMSDQVLGPASTTIYFAAAELLTNVARHSSASRATVRLAGTRDWLRLTVADDGRGGANPDGLGTGLDGLRRRAAALDGSVTVTSPPGGPTVVTVDVARV